MCIYIGIYIWRYIWGVVHTSIRPYVYIYIYIYICSYDNIHGCGVWMFLFSLHFHFIENGSITGGMKLGYFSSDYRSNSLGTPGG